MGAALALAERTRGRTAPNPNVGCVIVKDGRVAGRGWTQAGGRPHAEAMALDEAGAAARGATVYVTLEPCAHRSARGPACAKLLVAAGVARVVVAAGDPDPRTNGRGLKVLDVGGVATDVGVRGIEAHRSMAGFFTRRALGRPHVTLKLAMSLDGCIALASGESKWITGPEARAHVHLERSRHEAILVGRGTYEADAPGLDVRLADLEGRSPRRLILSSRSRHPSEGWDLPVSSGGEGAAGDPSLRWGDGDGWEVVDSPQAIADLDGVDHLFVEGGAATAAAFLHADLVDRLLLYRAPIVIGGGRGAVGDVDMTTLTEAHGKWKLHDARALGSDRLEVYERVRQ
ncbi:bifunctional diaminohydroxyphosphoribosylaminopyrimidine deaminase/5-amino-6-(5-phosphoribosylamino)uracil reductase RibD [Sphingomonas sp. SUN019]|uniref:bifunctional diaminohydroxyphosphoribosylaminopyrimidine deaminase/5-amino-6-(5-phosphoribosylamino)uracil reductase RibD n=1 Tax=Sphingomonas sp. SUN019 TaxID=2937788 RepID=UPI0021FEF234|nr:bifunctional diaminohydroxyphosphoribosylaminopyrimidine deaminase/5-amino-6-(5-phosphoribosylamino)uracil reductase RibD [Sphingomonas sp. SUN019]